MKHSKPTPTFLQRLKRLLAAFEPKRTLPYPVIDFAGYACVDPP